MKNISALRTLVSWLGLLSVTCALRDKPALARTPVRFTRANPFPKALALAFSIVVLLATVATAQQTKQQFSEAQLQSLEQQLDQTIAAAPPEFFAHSEKEFDQFMKRYVSLLPSHARLEEYNRVNTVVKTLGKNSVVKIFAAKPSYPGQIAFGRDGKVFLLDQALTVLTDEELTALLAHELAHDQRDTNRRIVIAASGNSLEECLQYNLLLRIEHRADEVAMSLLQQRGQNPDTLVKLLRDMVGLNVLPKQEAQDRIWAASTTLLRIRGFIEELDVNGGINASTIVGSQRISTGRLRKLLIGDEEFADLPARMIDNRSATEGRSENGLLPTRLFGSIYINNTQNFVILNPRLPEQRQVATTR